MKIRIDSELCTGHGRCYSLAPTIFEPDDAVTGQVIDGDVPPEREAVARRAVASCPERAVIVEG